MPKMKKCTICGKSFLSCNGVEVCSAACATEREHRQDTAGNERRRLQLSNQKTSRICPITIYGFKCLIWLAFYHSKIIRRLRAFYKLADIKK